MISLTPRAAAKASEMAEKQGVAKVLRVGIRGGGGHYTLIKRRISPAGLKIPEDFIEIVGCVICAKLKLTGYIIASRYPFLYTYLYLKAF